METLKIFVIKENRYGVQTIRRYIPNQNIPTFEPTYKNLIFTDKWREADYYIIINHPPNHGFPPERILYYKTEPEEFYYVPSYWKLPWVKKESFFYPMDEKHPRIQTWDLHKNWDYLKNFNFSIDKNWLMQLITTNYGDGTQVEQQLKGHIARMSFLKKFLEKYGNDPVWRLWGKRLEKYSYVVNHGEIYDKFDALWDSKYTFSFMNSNQPGFFDEKVTDAILCNCMPIVYGCPNLEKILPEHSFIRLDITAPDAVEKAWELIHSDYWEKHKDALDEAKQLILDKLSIVPRIYNDLMEIKKK